MPEGAAAAGTLGLCGKIADLLLHGRYSLVKRGRGDMGDGEEMGSALLLVVLGRDRGSSSSSSGSSRRRCMLVSRQMYVPHLYVLR